MALSNTAIINAKAAEKPYKLYDTDGLFLQVTPKGGKWWRLKYRFDGKEKLLSLGTYPDISLSQARQKREDSKKLLAIDIDPSENRKQTKADNKLKTENSFELVAREWWQSYMKNKAASHKEKVIRRFELYLFPWIGKKPISSITAPPKCLKL